MGFGVGFRVQSLRLSLGFGVRGFSLGLGVGFEGFGVGLKGLGFSLRFGV